MYFNRSSFTELFIHFRHKVQYWCFLVLISSLLIVIVIAVERLIQFLRFLLIKSLFNAGTFAFFVIIIFFDVVFVLALTLVFFLGSD